jgi:hypothetical protein
MKHSIHLAADADIVRIDGIELDDPEVADDVRSWRPEARADAVTEALWVGVITVGRMEATHAQRWYTTLLEELECQVGRDLL